MQALVLVGGEGTRLRPLTERVPKPALRLVDRPFLAYMIDWLEAHGVDEVVLSCGFLADTLRDVLGDGGGALRLRYVTEEEPLGTAGAIRHAAEHLDERFLALNGDVLTDLDLTELVRRHREREATATLGLFHVEDAAGYGLVRHDGDGRVSEFLEKPEPGQAGRGDINAGCYVLEREVLDLIPPGHAVSIEREVFPRLVGRGLFARVLDGYWMDIGTPERYLQATWDILEGRVRTRVGEHGEAVLVAAGAELAADAAIGPRAVISEGCRIAAGALVRGSVLLPGARVGERARVVDSILAPGAQVASGAVLDGGVVGERGTVAAG